MIATTSPKITNNQETQVFSYTHSDLSFYPIQRLVIQSLTGCAFYQVKVYKDSVLVSSFFAENNPFFSASLTLTIEPNSTLTIGIVPQDPLGQNHVFSISLQ
jgi:hypothetical protein